MHNQLFSFLSNTRTRVARAVLRGVCQVGSQRILRLVYISSIAGVLNDAKDVDRAMAHKLNDILSLTQIDDAVVVAAGEHSVIWGDLEDFDFVTVMDDKPTNLRDVLLALRERTVPDRVISEVAAAFTRKAPLWMRYGSDKLMEQDVEKLLCGMRKLMAQ